MELQYIEAEARARSKYASSQFSTGDRAEQMILNEGIDMQNNVSSLQAQLASFEADLDLLLERK
jgi:hypothetical protein